MTQRTHFAYNGSFSFYSLQRMSHWDGIHFLPGLAVFLAEEQVHHRAVLIYFFTAYSLQFVNVCVLIEE